MFGQTGTDIAHGQARKNSFVLSNLQNEICHGTFAKENSLGRRFNAASTACP
jgi:hypothetical protein